MQLHFATIPNGHKWTKVKTNLISLFKINHSRRNNKQTNIVLWGGQRDMIIGLAKDPSYCHAIN